MKTIILEVKYPNSVSADEIKDYCQNALECWGGQRHPDDHLFNTVKVLKNKMRVLGRYGDKVASDV